MIGASISPQVPLPCVRHPSSLNSAIVLQGTYLAVVCAEGVHLLRMIKPAAAAAAAVRAIPLMLVPIPEQANQKTLVTLPCNSNQTTCPRICSLSISPASSAAAASLLCHTHSASSPSLPPALTRLLQVRGILWWNGFLVLLVTVVGDDGHMRMQL